MNNALLHQKKKIASSVIILSPFLTNTLGYISAKKATHLQDQAHIAEKTHTTLREVS